MIPLCWVTGGGDQVKTTCLWSVSASNPLGEPKGAKRKFQEHLQFLMHYLVHLAVQNP